MSEIKWFKVLTDMFADDKIKIIQSMPEGDALLVMWFKVLAQAGKTNDGGYIYLKKNIPYTPAMLSTLFGKHQQLVEMALRTFSEFGMIDMDERGYIFVSNWERHQNIEGMEKVRDQTRKRVQAHREKKQLELLESNVTSSVTVTQSNATDIEEDLDIDIKTYKGRKRPQRTKFIPPTIDQVIAYCDERGRGIDPSKWYDHYTSNGWKVGKNSMQDWKAAVRTWERSNNTSSSTSTVGRTGQAAHHNIPTVAEQKERERKRLEEVAQEGFDW